jgi:HEPN domain
MNEPHIEAQRWLRQAQADLDVVHTLHAAGHHAAACFYSQQAAEKALKAAVPGEAFTNAQAQTAQESAEYIISVVATYFRTATDISG